MAFDPQTLPSTVRDAYFTYGAIGWMAVVQTAVQAGISDVDRLASIVFYLHHPERNGKKIEASEPEMINQWKAFRTLIKPAVPAMSKPSSKPKDPDDSAVDWHVDDVEAWQIQKAWGKELAEWAMIPPIGTEAKEFAPPSSMRDNYKTVFAWKSTNPNIKCVANPKQRLQILAMLRDDMTYWSWRLGGNRIGAQAVQSAAETAIRDYRDYIVNRNMCPKAAYNRLVGINNDMIYQMIIGFYQMLGPKGVPTSYAAGSEAIANGIGELIKYFTAKGS
ncbi:MAG: hypothetical protein ABI972_25020 [Acidobacteriota bacterium]